MQTNLPLDTYLNSTARWSALTDHRRYSNDDVQPLVPAFHPLIALPLRPGFSPEPEIETETAQQRNQRINQRLAEIQARTNPGVRAVRCEQTARPEPVRTRSASALKAWKTRRAHARDILRQGTNIGKHHA